MSFTFEDSSRLLMAHEVNVGGLANDSDSVSPWRDSPFLNDDISHNWFPEAEPRWKCIPKRVVMFVCSAPVQILLLLLLFILFGILIYELLAAESKVMVFQIVIFSLFVVERMTLILSEGKCHFSPLYQRYGILEDILLFISLLFQVIVWAPWDDKRKELVHIFQVLSVFPLADGRIRRFLLSVRRCVSLDRRRYRRGDLDLDIGFVHSTIGVMSWPGRNFEIFFRNPASEVKRLLDERYGSSFYRVYNLCSERRYDSVLFDGNVTEYPMDDHNPAELKMMLSFVRDAGDFVRKDVPRRAIVVHCKGGKGRTGTMVCAYLMYTGLQRTAENALRFFGQIRTAENGKFQGVQTPSQHRYVRYFEKLLKTAKPPAPLTVPKAKKKIVELILENIPALWCKGGIAKLWFAIIANPCTERNVLFLSNPSITFNPYPPKSLTEFQEELREIFIPPEESLYNDSQKVDLGNKVTPSYDAFNVCFEDQCVSTSCFDRQLSEPSYSANGFLGKGLLDSTPVMLKALQLNKIPALDGDVVVKFFYANNEPKALEAPLQFWFHTAMEECLLRIVKTELDGPHKDVKNRLYPENFTVNLRMEASAD